MILQVDIERRETALAEVSNLKEKLSSLEDDLAKKNEMTKEANEKTAELGKENEESLRVARVLKNKTSSEDGKVAALEKQLGQSVLMEKEVETKYEEVIKKLNIVESKLEIVDKRAENCETEKETSWVCSATLELGLGGGWIAVGFGLGFGLSWG